MSRLADAESKLAAALEALEAAIASTGKDAAPANGMPDSAMIISEIGRIDAQLGRERTPERQIRGAADRGWGHRRIRRPTETRA